MGLWRVRLRPLQIVYNYMGIKQPNGTPQRIKVNLFQQEFVCTALKQETLDKPRNIVEINRYVSLQVSLS